MGPCREEEVDQDDEGYRRLWVWSSWMLAKQVSSGGPRGTGEDEP